VCCSPRRLGVFVLGALPVTVMVLVVLALAGAEAYAGFRSAGRTPPRCSASSRSSRSASPSTTRASPRSGRERPPDHLRIRLYLNADRAVDVLDGLGATIFVYVWIGVIGSYALLFVARTHSSTDTDSPTSSARWC